MRLRILHFLLLIAVLVLPQLSGQPPVTPTNVFERIYVIVPLVGKGTMDDPRRPLFAPSDQDKDLPEEERILSFTAIPSDDGRFALVEFVAKDRAAFRRIAEQGRDLNLKLFVKGRDSKVSVEQEFRKLKRDFTLDSFNAHGFDRKAGAR